MGTTERREREKQELRDRILDAARTLFAEQGYDAVTMRKIAEKIEYSPTAIYFHFKDKQTLLQELCDTDFGALAHEFQKIARIADPIERLRQIGRAYVGFAIEFPNHYRLMFMTPSKATLGPEGSRLAHGNPEEDAYAFLRATVAEAIAAAACGPSFPTPTWSRRWSGPERTASCLSTSPTATTNGSSGATPVRPRTPSSKS